MHKICKIVNELVLLELKIAGGNNAALLKKVKQEVGITMQTLTVKALHGFTALSNEELEMVDGGAGGTIIAAAALAYTIGYAVGVVSRRLYDGTY